MLASHKLLKGIAFLVCGSACGPVIVPVFKTGERQAILSLVGSTPTRFRHLFPMACGQEPAKNPVVLIYLTGIFIARSVPE